MAKKKTTKPSTKVRKVPKLVFEEMYAKAATELEKYQLEVATLELALQMAKYHLQKCESETGEILLKDVEYCVDMIHRVAKHKKSQYKHS